MDSPLLTKSKQFALDIIKVCNKVKSEKRHPLDVFFQLYLFFAEQVRVPSQVGLPFDNDIVKGKN